ncbi:MAG: hypothetical protein PHY47_03780 [Lachnospiraceae bacterium]|nr:hypothetical protein [Lachnospiraceae bacterium]
MYLFQEVLIYVIFIFLLLGILTQFIQEVFYNLLIKETENMTYIKNKNLIQIKLKFENYYKLNCGVNNISVFVDKYFYKFKFCGLNIFLLEQVPAILLEVAFVLTAIGSISDFNYNLGIRFIFTYLSFDLVGVLIYYIIKKGINISHKKEIVKTNMIDYLQNTLINHLGQESIRTMGSLSVEEREMLETPLYKVEKFIV